MMDVNSTEKEFLEIIEHNEARLKHLCRVYANRKEGEKDLYQEIIIQAWRSFPSFNGKAKVGTWLYRLAFNTAISAVRKRKTRQKYHAAYKMEYNPERRDETSYPKQGEKQIEKLYQAISQLGTPEKAIITMYLEEFSYEEIAYVIGITENYVGVKLNRIKMKLSKMMEG